MAKFTLDDVSRYSFQYDDVSEPLREYKVGLDGSLIELPSSCTLLGVEKFGKWGWIDTSEKFVIPSEYDSGFVLCYNGIIVLQKDDKYGALYRNSLTKAFHFRYSWLEFFYNDTYVAWNDDNRCALLKPGDRPLTQYSYKGFSKYNRGNITEYVKPGIFGDKHGKIDLDTGRELS